MLMFTGDGFNLNSGFTKIWCTPENPLRFSVKKKIKFTKCLIPFLMWLLQRKSISSLMSTQSSWDLLQHVSKNHLLVSSGDLPAGKSQGGRRDDNSWYKRVFRDCTVDWVQACWWPSSPKRERKSWRTPGPISDGNPIGRWHCIRWSFSTSYSNNFKRKSPSQVKVDMSRSESKKCDLSKQETC